MTCANKVTSKEGLSDYNRNDKDSIKCSVDDEFEELLAKEDSIEEIERVRHQTIVILYRLEILEKLDEKLRLDLRIKA